MDRIRYKEAYEQLFANCIIHTSRVAETDALAGKLITYKPRYEAVSRQTNVPWYFIGVVHCMEASLDFTTHLHNGDPLTARTFHVPKGRPLNGKPPFSWEESAVDAMYLKKFQEKNDWRLGNLLYCLEQYNGFGYRKKGIHSPYLWSFSNHYVKGKYKADGIYDPEAVSKQCGAAVLLKQLEKKGAIIIEV
jgi:lysozyme family protein